MLRINGSSDPLKGEARAPACPCKVRMESRPVQRLGRSNIIPLQYYLLFDELSYHAL